MASLNFTQGGNAFYNPDPLSGTSAGVFQNRLLQNGMYGNFAAGLGTGAEAMTGAAEGVAGGLSNARTGAARLAGQVGNAGLNASKFLGPASLLVGGGLDYMNRKQKGEGDVRAAIGTAGGAAGGLGGAAAGAAAGSFLGPLGTVIGGIGGGILGSMGGSAAGNFTADRVQGQYGGYDNPAAAIAKSTGDLQDAVKSGDTQKIATAYQNQANLVKQKRQSDLQNTGAAQSMASVGGGVQDSMMKNLNPQGMQNGTASPIQTAGNYSNEGMEFMTPGSPEYNTEMTTRRVSDMQRDNAGFQQGLMERGATFSQGLQEKQDGSRTRNSMLSNYLAGAQQGNTSALISAYNQRY